jgi:hypothetical protein
MRGGRLVAGWAGAGMTRGEGRSTEITCSRAATDTAAAIGGSRAGLAATGLLGTGTALGTMRRKG